MGNSTRKDIARQFIEATGANDRDTLRTIVSQDIIWWTQPIMEAQGVERPLRGWDNVPWLSGEGSKAFKPGTTTWVYHHFVQEDDFVVVHMNRECETATGGRYDNEYYFMFRFEGDTIVEFWESCDTANAFSMITPTNYSEDSAIA